jgi:hypothetical protein
MVLGKEFVGLLMIKHSCWLCPEKKDKANFSSKDSMLNQDLNENQIKKLGCMIKNH